MSGRNNNAGRLDAFESVDTILEAHFGNCKRCVDDLVSAWSDQRQDQEGLNDVLLFLYRAANYPRNDFIELLEGRFGGRDEILNNEGLLESYDFLNTLSQHCCADFEERGNLLFIQCREVMSSNRVDDTSLKQHIAEYINSEVNFYLNENFPEISEVIASLIVSPSANTNPRRGVQNLAESQLGNAVQQ